MKTERAPSVGSADSSPVNGGAGNARHRSFFRSPVYGGAGPKGLRGLFLFTVLFALVGGIMIAAATQPIEQPLLPEISDAQPIIDDFPSLPDANSFSICIENQSYRGCCSSHQGVKDITNDYLICMDGAPSRSCSGVNASLRGCCKDHGGIYGAETDGVVACNDKTTSPTCHIGICETDRF